MAGETAAPEKQETLQDLTRRAAQVARNSTLRSINLLSLAADRLAMPTADESEIEVSTERSVSRDFSPEREEAAARLVVRVDFMVNVREISSQAALVNLKAVFESVYDLNRGMPAEAERDLDAFAVTNAVVHVWPYYRELVQSTTWRMGLPPFPLPLFRITDASPTSKPKPSEG